ncbi:MAG: FeoA family protein [Clostridiales bacterium]
MDNHIENQITQLSRLLPGGRGLVRSSALQGSMRRRLQDLGLVEGTLVRCLHQGPSGDPMAYDIRGAVIALRKEDAQHILIEREARPWQ